MKKTQLTLNELKVKSFITLEKQSQQIGASGCCLRDTDQGLNNCFTFGPCHSTGSGDDPTGMFTAITNESACP